MLAIFTLDDHGYRRQLIFVFATLSDEISMRAHKDMSWQTTFIGDIKHDVINPLRSNTDQRQTSLCNMNAFSVREVMRIQDVIIQREFC